MRSLIMMLLLVSASVPAACKIHKLPKTKDIRSIERRAEKTQNKELLDAIAATKAIHQKYHNLGIKKRSFLKTAYHIETHRNNPKLYTPKKKSHLSHSIEYDPRTNHTFIILDSKKALIGQGKKKKVFKAIHYSRNPKLLARAEQTVDMRDEKRAHKALKGRPGLMNAHALTTYKYKRKTYNSIYSDLYKGTLQEALKRKISTYNKLIIMSDLLSGLESIHSKKFAHRDLHTYNYLFYEEPQPHGIPLIRAVIADLGRTIKAKKATKQPAQMVHRFRAPEAFKCKKMKGRDYFATDIYALGCTFYRLYYEKYPEWQYSSITARGSSKKLLSILKDKVTKRRNQLERKQLLTHSEKMEYIVLKMLHKNPKKRGSAKKLQKMVQELI